MIRTPEGDLEQELRDPEYVKLYGASDAKAEIAITLAEARHAAKKTQKEVADAMSLSQPYVARLEGGEANPTIGTIGSLLAVMGFRLAARTASLKPEPILSFHGSVLIGAADESQWGGYISPAYPVNAGIVADSVSHEPAKREREVALVGGAGR